MRVQVGEAGGLGAACTGLAQSSSHRCVCDCSTDRKRTLSTVTRHNHTTMNTADPSKVYSSRQTRAQSLIRPHRHLKQTHHQISHQNRKIRAALSSLRGVLVPHEELSSLDCCYSTATGYVIMPNIAYLVSGLFKGRMRSRRCAIVFTHRIVAKTRAAVASALFDSREAGRLSFVSGQTSIAPLVALSLLEK